MNSKYKKLTLNTIIFAIGNFGSKVIAFFLVPLYTNVLSTAEYGTADLILSITNLLLPVVSMSIGEAILFFGLKEKNNKEKVIKNGLLVWGVGAIAMLVITPLISLYAPVKSYALYTSIYTIFLSLRLALQLYTKAREKNFFFSIDSIVHASLVCILNILFLLVFKMGMWGYLYALLFAEILSTIGLFIYNKGFSIVFTGKIEKSYIKEMLKYSAPLILNSISWALAYSLDKVMLEAMVSIDAVGLYSVASRIPTLVTTLTGFFCQAWTMSAILEFESKDREFYKNTFSTFFMVLCFVVCGVLLILKPFMKVYVGANFYEAWKYVPFLLMAAIFQNFSSFFGSIIQSAQKNNSLLVTSLASCFTNLILNYLLIPVLGIQGAVIGTLGSYVVVGVYRIAFALKVMPFDIKLPKLVVAILILLLQTVVCVYDYHSVIISLIVIMLLCGIFYRDLQRMTFFLVNKTIKKENL